VDELSNTILIAPMTDSKRCISLDGEFKSYRGTVGIYDSTNLTNAFSNSTTGQLYAVTFGANPRHALMTAVGNSTNLKTPTAGILGCATTVSTDHIMRFMASARFDNGNNYVYGDTSAKFSPLARTLDPTRFQWGKAGYSIGGGTVLNPITNQPVQ
jgi:hypothetical protein